MSPLVITLLVVGGLVVLALVALVVLVSRAARAARGRLAAVLRGEPILRMAGGANYSGKESDKVRLRGNGILALSPTRLIFVMWAPKVTLELPLSHVTAARAEAAFQGRVAPTLVVTFRNRAEAVETCGWAVGDAEGWAARVEAARLIPPRPAEA